MISFRVYLAQLRDESAKNVSDVIYNLNTDTFVILAEVIGDPDEVVDKSYWEVLLFRKNLDH